MTARPDFSRRSDRAELMDGPCDYATFRGCLVDLARVNRLTLAYRPTLAFFERLRREGRLPQGRPLRVLDVGSGYGDMLRKVADWARGHGVPVALTGIDLNPFAARAAAEAAHSDPPITWRTGDALDLPESEPVDVVLTALVAHHLPDAALIRFLAWQDRTARIGWFVNDLHRHPLPYHAFGAGARMLRMHPFVQHDGPVSIARGFVRRDWQRLLAEAGVTGAEVEGWVPFRLCVAQVRGDDARL
ncbi:methyltransferase domain-containing protein [Falsirhodobacter algicola]|uniref:Methyltransferase domain-containing protein n=1 Tax=Falsirhodobacter algicola TaxID=2692330 RepID=A0A8J8SLY9_9RHOB|nr:methyltransferase domain-containing protein [Falsirhodobacter algicola]QUS37048.1 methyltransferase domain-containing protein [Falsirhodobacter algicola]